MGSLTVSSLLGMSVDGGWVSPLTFNFSAAESGANADDSADSRSPTSPEAVGCTARRGP